MNDSDLLIRYIIVIMIFITIVGGLVWLFVRSGKKQFANMEADIDKWRLRIFKTESDVAKLKAIREEFIEWIMTMPHFGEDYTRKAASLIGFLDGRIHECDK